MHIKMVYKITTYKECIPISNSKVQQCITAIIAAT